MKCSLDIRGELNFRFNLGWCGSVGSKSLRLPLAHRCSLARALAEFSSSGPGGVKGGLQPQLFIRLASWQQKFLARLKCHFHGCWHTWVGLRFQPSLFFAISGFLFFFTIFKKFYEFSYQFKRRETTKIYVLKVASCHNDKPIYISGCVCVCVGQLFGSFWPSTEWYPSAASHRCLNLSLKLPL